MILLNEMRLSKEGKAILDTGKLNPIEARLVSEFSGHELPLKPGDIYFHSHHKDETWWQCTSQIFISLGKASHILIDIYIVRKRTPKSYVCEYKQSVAVINTKRNVGVHGYYNIPVNREELHGTQRRFFPQRHKNKVDQAAILDLIMYSPQLDDLVKCVDYSDALYLALSNDVGR